MSERLGMTIPLDGVPLSQQASIASELAELGYTDFWSAEGSDTDGFSPLAVASVAAPAVRLGTAIIPVFTRGPGVLALSAASMAATAAGRFVLGIGASSDVIVERWNDIPFDRPLQRTRDTARFLRKALRGERVDEEFETFTVRGFRLGIVPEVQPPILIAALCPGMLRLAGKEADGAVINWLSAEDVRKVAPFVNASGPGKEIVARIFVAPTTDSALVRETARRHIAAYLNVSVYRKFHEWLGRTELQPMWDLWDAGDRKQAVAAIPDSVVDQLVVHGSPQECHEHLDRYVANGVTTPVISLWPIGIDIEDAVRSLAPRRLVRSRPRP